MFFKTEQQPQTLDVYDKVWTLTKELLYAECPQHRAHHHILYTANDKLVAYAEARDAVRAQINNTTHCGQWMQQLYETATKKHNQLQLLIRAYMHLSDERSRLHFNHHFKLADVLIEQLYEQLTLYKQYRELLEMDPSFWQALKDDFLPLVTQLE